MNIIELLQTDITKIECDAIVNAANSTLLGGGGVDGAIHRYGGIKILNECEIIGSCKTGNAVITTGGNLPAKKVIHTVGPIWNNGKSNEDILLGNCYENSLKLANENNIKSIAFPNISTGIYGFPKERAAEIAIKSVKKFIRNKNSIEKIYFVCFDDENYNLYKNLL